MKKEKTRWFGIPKLFPYLKGYGRLVLVDMIALGFIGSAMDAVIPLFQQYAIDHFIADRTLAGLGAFAVSYTHLRRIHKHYTYFMCNIYT